MPHVDSEPLFIDGRDYHDDDVGPQNVASLHMVLVVVVMVVIMVQGIL